MINALVFITFRIWVLPAFKDCFTDIYRYMCALISNDNSGTGLHGAASSKRGKIANF